jgi:primosomal protein N''
MTPSSRPDYFERFAGLLQVLDHDQDIDRLAAEEGYSRRIGENFRQVRRATLERYLIELEADFEELKRAAEEKVLFSRDYAEQLLTTQDALRRCKRYIKLRLAIERLIPTPGPKAKLKILRRLVLAALPRASVSYEVLAKMNALSAILRP